MLTAERREKILQLAREHGAVQVPDLSQRFGVSASTIRRDLEWLAERGELQRTYGGAVAPPTVQTAPTQDDATERIGQAAAALILPGETVFIGPGKLCHAAARHLCQRADVTVITNALGVAWTLIQNSSLPVVVTGGSTLRPGGALIGQMALATLETLRADRLIIEVAGISPVEGLTADQLPLADVLRPLIASVAQVIVLAAAERLGRTGAAWLCPLGEVDVIITGREASTALVWDISETGVKVTLV